MTTSFKPGTHPDADQLSAFIEQALPAHERDGVLAHLAMCPDCRAVVALALPEEQVAIAAPEPRRSSVGKSWFSNWMVFLPAAAAVAALALFVVFGHRQAPAPQQQAHIEPAPAAPVPENPQAAPSKQADSRQLSQPRAESPLPQAETAMRAAPPKPPSDVEQSTGQSAANGYSIGQNAITEDKSIQAAPAQNAVNSFAGETNNGAVNQNQLSNQTAAPRSTFHGGAVAGTLQSNNNLKQANTQDRQQLNSPQQSTTQTVQVQTGAAPIETTSAELSAVVAARNESSMTFTRRPVPSGQPLLSSAANGPLILAIDSHHAVFVSSDSGQHWKTVHAVWKGRAVMVEAAAQAKMLMLPVASANLQSFTTLSQDAVAAKKTGAIVTGTVTDQTGAVISRATVTITDPRTNHARTVTTDVNGRYIAAELDPGNYNLDATAPGFMNTHLSDVAMTSSKENVANFTMRVGAATQSVTVEASQSSIEARDGAELKTPRKPKAATSEKAKQASPPLFEIVTDKGAHWTSVDGLTWQPK